MKLIPLEEVRSSLKCFIKYEESLNEQMDSFTTIDLSIIDKMIEGLIPSSSFGTGIINSRIIDALQKLKSRLSLNK